MQVLLLVISILYLFGFGMYVLLNSWSTYILLILLEFILCIWLGDQLPHWVGGGWMAAAAVASLVLPFLVGNVAGAATKAVLLITKWPMFSIRSLLAILVGVSLPPGGLAGWQYGRAWYSGYVYARLPDATTLPAVPVCAKFRTAGPLLDTVLAKASDEYPGFLPETDAHLRYPAAYLTPAPPRLPRDLERSPYIEFAMHIADAGPVPRGEIVDGENHWIPFDRQVPSVDFRLAPRPPMAKDAALRIQSAFGSRTLSSELPELKMVPSPYPSLTEAVSPDAEHTRKDVFVSQVSGDISDLLVCSKIDSEPNPICKFSFDRGGIPIEGRFRRAALANWPEIAVNIRSFVDCAREAADAVPTKSIREP